MKALKAPETGLFYLIDFFRYFFETAFYIFGTMQKPITIVYFIVCFFCACNNDGNSPGKKNNNDSTSNGDNKSIGNQQKIDTAVYNKLLLHMANGDTTGHWPVKHEYPKAGAIFPYKRVVAYYGNLYSKLMGILGELPKDSMFKRLMGEVKKWQAADSLVEVVPALHYIAITAQSKPGESGKYRMRMPFNQIDTIIKWAKEINALVFIDIQVGLSTLQQELPEFEKYLAMPNVHFGIDPEFSMKGGERPGTIIGTFDAADINYVNEYLSGIVKKYDIPPKILIIHRFTQDMITNYKNIKLFPEVQIVMDMDGWGEPLKKVGTYNRMIFPEPVQFTGFKIFYKNDTKRVNQTQEMQPADLLKLVPRPVYIQYQ